MKLLDECTELAERGGFEFSWDIPGESYFPSTMKIHEEEDVMERLKSEYDDEFISGLSAEALEEYKQDIRNEMIAEELPEYAELGSWWMPSRNC